MIAPTPQRHTLRGLKEALVADFAAHDINCTVEIDVWAPEANRGEPRITIEMGDGTIGEPAPFHFQPGAWDPVSLASGALPAAATLTLAGGSTITGTLSGTPTAAASVLILIGADGVTGPASAITYAVSYDNGGLYGPAQPLGDATSITVLGAAVALGTGTIAQVGDTLAWTQRRATSDLARPILDDAQTYHLMIHAPSPANAADARRAEPAQDATDQLLRQAMAAIRRQLAAPFRAPARVRWPKTIAGYPAFVYGSVCTVDLVIGSPILDDAAAAGQAIEWAGSSTVNFGDGSVSNPETQNGQA